MVQPYFFYSSEYIEPRCPKCSKVLDYGINTTFDEKKKNHVCNCCGEALK